MKPSTSVILGCTSLFLTLTTGTTSTPPPNMIWIMADDLGYGEVSIMPGRFNTNISTPNIDALFQSGTWFTDAYCGQAVCAPSRASLMTGYNQGHCWIRGNYPGTDGHGLPLRQQDTTFLQILQSNGYHVACIGKWGLGWVDNSGAPHLKGCDEYFGVLDQNYAHNMYPSLANFTWRYPASNGDLTYEAIPYPENVNASREQCMGNISSCTWTHDLWTNAALATIANQSNGKYRNPDGTTKPIFIYLAYTDPHAGGWTGTEEEGNPVPSDGNFAGETTWPDPEKDHASVIQNYLDQDVGRIINALETNNLRKNTAVFFASDNGASNEGNHDYMFFGSSGPLRGFKRCLTEGGIRTAFTVSWPGTIPARVKTNYTTAFWDMMPTIIDMAGISSSQLPTDIDGISIWNVLSGQGTVPTHPPLYWEFCTSAHPPGVNRTGPGWGHAVRIDNWKGVSFFEDQSLFLYDLSTDLGETTDVSGQNPTIIAQMEAYSKKTHVDNPYFPIKNCVPS